MKNLQSLCVKQRSAYQPPAATRVDSSVRCSTSPAPGPGSARASSCLGLPGRLFWFIHPVPMGLKWALSVVNGFFRVYQSTYNLSKMWCPNNSELVYKPH